jgi:excisionase family DNA binding protein
MMTEIPQLLTLIDLAERLRLSPHTIRALVRQGKLTPIRICRRLLFHPAEVVRFLTQAK